MNDNGHYPPEEKALNAALAAAQGEFPPISRERTVEVKTRDGSKYSYSYAPLDVILAGVRPALAKHGLALVQRLENPGGQGPAIRTELRHAEGAVIASSFPLGERPSSPQQLGSLLTYLRRYAIIAMLGIAPEDDDDGQAAASPFKAPKPKDEPVTDFLTASQRRKIFAIRTHLTGAGVFTDEQFKTALERDFGIDTVTDLTKTQASQLIERLEKREAAIDEGTADA